MILKINFLNQIKMLSSSIFVFLALIVFLLYSKTNEEMSLYIISACFLLFGLPVLIIHYNYYKRNKSIVFTITEDGITEQKAGIEIEYKATHFKEIELIMTGIRMSGIAFGNFIFEEYYYGKIHLKNGSEIVISCLYAKNIDKILISKFKNVPVKYTTNFYPLI